MPSDCEMELLGPVIVALTGLIVGCVAYLMKIEV